MVSPAPALPPRRIVTGPVPKHEQLRAILEEACRTTFHTGDPLPGERALAEEFGVSRITVRRAISDLVAAGRLKRIRGAGTFVAPNPLVSRLQLASFSEEMRAQQVEASSTILLAARAHAPADVTEFFGADIPHIHLRRLRLGGEEPYAIDNAWYNAALVPDMLEHDIHHSVYTLLQQHYQLEVTDADQTVTAVAADPTQAALLDVPAHSPLLQIVRYACAGDAPIEACTSVYRTDRYRLSTRAGRE